MRIIAISISVCWLMVDKIKAIKVSWWIKTIITNNSVQPSPDFYGLGIAPKILDILAQLKFKVPTPIQLKAIPMAIWR